MLIGLGVVAKGAALNAVKRGDVPKGPWGENGPQLSDVKECEWLAVGPVSDP